MSNFPAIRGKPLIAALKKIGFAVIRVNASHHFLRHDDGRTTVVPVQAGETLGPGILRAIHADCELTKEQLHELL